MFICTMYKYFCYTKLYRDDDDEMFIVLFFFIQKYKILKKITCAMQI